MIADFHEQGLLLIDGARNLVEGYLYDRTRCTQMSVRAFSILR